MNRILLIEDHERLAELMCKALGAAGIAVDVIGRIDMARDAIERLPYQALILDRGLPDGDGLSLLQQVRDAWGLNEAVTPNALDVAVHRIRRKLLAIGSRQRIVNVRGLGYALRQAELDQ